MTRLSLVGRYILNYAAIVANSTFVANVACHPPWQRMESKMNSLIPTPSAAVLPFMDPFGFGRSAFDYWRDALERSVLYMDVMRHRGNQYLDHIQKTKPSVMRFETEVLMDGRELPRPVNYELLRILPPAGIEIDPLMRPFVVVDPRAGHGPGIGGFKPDSEIGVALRAGHPCYFIGFLPYPEPGQTVEDVVVAEAAFLRHVIERHPQTSEKPMVVGNCQAGWQIMMAAALEPDLFGPILIAGTPLSYWAGERGKAPMRYTGGMTAGSWMTSLLSDLGCGLFDGAWLVQNFENLNPANTWWTKQYRLFNNVDTGGRRYLEFERWWGAHVMLGGEEIQYIVDNLFVGNRLSTARMRWKRSRPCSRDRAPPRSMRISSTSSMCWRPVASSASMPRIASSASGLCSCAPARRRPRGRLRPTTPARPSPSGDAMPDAQLAGTNEPESPVPVSVTAEPQAANESDAPVAESPDRQSSGTRRQSNRGKTSTPR